LASPSLSLQFLACLLAFVDGKTHTQFLTGMHGVVLKNKEVDVSGVEPMYSCLQDEVSVQVRDILLFSFSLMLCSGKR
jgi:hypothetical protein